MDEALFFSLQLEKFPGHEATMQQFAEANGIPFDLERIYQLIEKRRRDEEHYAAKTSIAMQENNDADCLGSWRAYLNARLNVSEPATHKHQTHHALPEPSGTTLKATGLVAKVIARRKALGLTQAEFARRLGVSVRTYQDWEQGRRQPSGPSEAMLRRSL